LKVVGVIRKIKNSNQGGNCIGQNQDCEQFVETKLKSEIYSIVDRTEDLMYRMLSTVNDLKSRGHAVLMYQQADNLYQEHLHDPKLSLLNSCPEIVHGFNGVPLHINMSKVCLEQSILLGSPYVPPDMTHPEQGQHHVLNTYLTNYINEHKILQ
jgi:hypothetical protein